MTISAPLVLERLAHDARGVQSVVGGALDELSRVQSVEQMAPFLELARRGLARLKISADRSAAIAEILSRAPIARPVALKAQTEHSLDITKTLARRGVTVERDLSEGIVEADETFVRAAITEAVALATRTARQRVRVQVAQRIVVAESDGRVTAQDADADLARAIIEEAVGVHGGQLSWSNDPVRISIDLSAAGILKI